MSSTDDDRGRPQVGGTARRLALRSGLALAAVFAASVLAGCGGDDKTYDIAPIFPLSSDKCARYDGETDGTGIAAHCWVTKEQCEQAASDWARSMRTSGVTDGIRFSC